MDQSFIFFENISWGWKCLGVRLILTCLRTRQVSGLEMSHGRTCLKAGDVQGWKCLAAGSVQKFRAGSVSRQDLFLGRKCLGASSSSTRNSVY